MKVAVNGAGIADDDEASAEVEAGPPAAVLATSAAVVVSPSEDEAGATAEVEAGPAAVLPVPAVVFMTVVVATVVGDDASADVEVATAAVVVEAASADVEAGATVVGAIGVHSTR